MRKYSNTYYWHRRQRRSTFSRAFFFSWCQKGQNRQHEKERKKEATERERERTREKKREKELERTRESFNQKHLNRKSTTFCSREKKTQKTLSLNTSNGEPRSGGNLERVTREKRERGACLIVCVVVFSLFSFSLIKEARAKSAKDSVPLNEVTPYLRRVFVDPIRNIIKRDESFSLFSIVLFSTNERTTKTILASSVVLFSLVVTESLVVVYHSFT